MTESNSITTGTVLRYPLYDENGVLLLKGGSPLTLRLAELLEQRQISVAVYATLEVTQGAGEQREIAVRDKALTIGRGTGCDVRPAYPLVSKRHCVVRKHGYSVMIRDLASTNGTFVNGARIRDAVELSDGDVITLGGGVSMTVRIFAAVRGDYGAAATGVIVGNAPAGRFEDSPTVLTGELNLQEVLEKSGIKWPPAK